MLHSRMHEADQWNAFYYILFIYHQLSCLAHPSSGKLVRLRAALTFLMAFWKERLVVDAHTCIRARLVGDSFMAGVGQNLISTRGWHLHGELGMVEHVVGSDYTLFNVRIVSISDGVAIFQPGENFLALRHSGETHINMAAELCCGLGGMSLGAEVAGFQVVAGVDVSKWALQVFRANHRATPIHGSVADPATIARLFQVINCHSIGFLMGFPCPPFSSFGDQRGFQDARAWTFVAGLDLVYLLNGQFIILECTPHVESFTDFRMHLDSFAHAMKFAWKSQVLCLDDAWPARRTRWWSVVAPEPIIACLNLQSFPTAPHLKTLQSVIPTWPRWSPEEEQLLKLTDEEIDFHEQFAVLDDLLLNVSGKCPTLLHSLGHLDRACPCACRDHGLSVHRLFKDGISTVLLRCVHSDGLRFPHPCEAGFFCTLPPSFRYLCIREALPLIGQTAAPLQAHWIALILKHAILRVQGHQPFGFSQLLQEHSAFQDHLQSLAWHLWPTAMTEVPRMVKLRFESGCTLVLQVEALATIEQLIQAQKSLGGWGAKVQVLFQGQSLPFGAILRTATYDIRCYEPKQLQSPPTGEFMYALFHEDRVWVGTLKPGTLLGVLLSLLGFQYHPGLRVLANGHAWTWGDFLWSPFVGDLVLPIFGAGLVPYAGLNNFQIDHEADALVRYIRPSAFVVLPSGPLTKLLDLPLDLAREALLALVPTTAHKVFGIFSHHGHWAAFFFDRPASVGYYFDGIPGPAEQVARFCVDSLAAHFRDSLVVFRARSWIPQTHGSHCGTVALAHLGLVLGRWTSFSEHEAVAWYHSIQAQTVVAGGHTEYSRAHTFLLQELPKHGVPPEAAAGRAALALKKISPAAVLKAMESKSPWQALKSLGSAPDKPFQWVQHSELEQHIEARAMNKTGKMAKQKQKKSAPAPKAVALLPNQVHVAPGAFCDSEGERVNAISLDAISNTARGIIVVAVEQAMRYLVDNKKVSVDALALLTMSVLTAPPDCALQITEVTWPGLHADTQEPLLIRGTCIQLGDVRIDPKHGKQVAASVDTDLLRIFAYRDQWPSPWAELTAGPLRALIAHFGALQYCPGDDCGSNCSKFHAAVDEDGINMVVLDAFAWRWMDSQGKTVPAGKAQAFSIMIRVPCSGTDALLALSGTDGFYSELRAPDTQPSNTKYGLIWLKDNFDDAQHLKTTEAEVYKVVFPGKQFVACAANLHYEMGPWPYGVTKQVITEFLAGMPWVAKPLRPVKGGMQGRYWLIGADSNPPCSVVAHTEAFLTITKVKDIAPSKEPPSIVASMKTLNRLHIGSAASSSDSDPWGTNDPWKNWHKSEEPVVTVKPSAAAVTKIDEMEARLAAKFSEQIAEQVRAWEPADADMESDQRLNKLESGITELQAQQAKFHGWCQEAADKMTLMTQRITQQDTNIASLNTQVVANAAATEKLGQSLGNMQTQISCDMQAAMEKQTSHLEALLSKRLRTE